MQQVITNEIYQVALDNIDNKRIIKSATKKFNYLLDQDDIKSCQLMGLWKALLSFDKSKGTKFTSHLYKIVTNECKKVAYKKSHLITNLSFDKINTNNYCGDVYNIIEELAPHEKELIVNYYIEKMTLKEISQKLGVSVETTRRRLKKAIIQITWI